MTPRKPRRTPWVTYLRRVVGDDTQAQIVRRTGLDQATVSRVLKGERGVTLDTVTKIAHGYDVSWTEAMYAAGLASREDVESQIVTVDWDNAPTEALALELARRVRPGAVA